MIYPSKLLLFGEHTVLYGSEALAIPMWIYNGCWSDEIKNYDNYKYMYSYIQWLEENIPDLDHKKIKTDHDSFISVDSNIPIGYGAGSSGMLCAAIFDRYHIGKPMDMLQTKAYLSNMESYFHGKSSGLDPIVSFYKQNVKVKENGELEIIRESVLDEFIFVVDTELSRSTSDYVEIFKKQMDDEQYSNRVYAELFPLVQDGIYYYEHEQLNPMVQTMKQIGFFQYKYMKKFIPEHMQFLFENSFDQEVFSLKICGAGGGGFLVGSTNDKEYVTELMNRYKIDMKFIK
jgi:mevalonate kinase